MLELARAAVATAGVVLVSSCAGGSDAMRASLADVDPNDARWAIRSACEGGSFAVDFRPREQLVVSELASVSYEEIAVECGDAERVVVGPESGAPAAADLTAPSYAVETLACDMNGVLTVSVNPIWGQRGIVGSSLLVLRADKAVLAGSLKRDEYEDKGWSRLAWSRALCRPS